MPTYLPDTHNGAYSQNIRAKDGLRRVRPPTLDAKERRELLPEAPPSLGAAPLFVFFESRSNSLMRHVFRQSPGIAWASPERMRDSHVISTFPQSESFSNFDGGFFIGQCRTPGVSLISLLRLSIPRLIDSKLPGNFL